MDSDHATAVQAVVDRVSSYQDGATEGTLETELRAALTEADLELSEQQVATLVAAIERDGGEVDVASVL